MSDGPKQCPICRSPATKKMFDAIIMDKYQAVYRFCNRCHFLFVETPGWLSEAYKDPINIYDTGVMARNISFSKETAIIIYFFFKKEGRFLDYAGGYGILTRLMRDIGFDFYWHDPYSTNLIARGFEIAEGSSNFELVTCFEVLEHFIHPLKEIEKMFRFSDNILFSTTPLPTDIPEPKQWSHYGLKHGQHISFYSFKTLQFIAQKFGCNLYYSRANLYLLTKHPLNSLFFDFLLKWNGRKLFPYVKRHMKSKTDEDSNLLALSKKRD